MCQVSQTQDGGRTAKIIQNIVSHYGNQELQPGPTDQLSHNTMKARRNLIQIKHHFFIFSFRYLKKFLLRSSTIEANRKLSRGTECTKIQFPKQHILTHLRSSGRVLESRILRQQATPCYCWRHKLGHVGFQHEVHWHDFSPSPKSMPGARINGGCGVSNRSLSPLPLQDITRNW